MAVAELGDVRLVAFLEHIAGGFRRKDRAERRAVEAQGRAEGGARRLEQGATFADIAGDVLEICGRQDGAAAIAVEDNEVELVDLDVEEFADRKGDERKLADGRAVLLLGRAQDGEVD